MGKVKEFDLEELNEEETEDSQAEEEKEELEEILEEDVVGQHINRFLANPWKQVAFETGNVIDNLEEDLPEVSKKEEKFDGGETLDYLTRDEVENGKYETNSLTLQAKEKNENSILSEDDRGVLEQKRMYDNVQKMMGADSISSENDFKTVTLDKTIKDEYLRPKKFNC